MTILKKILAISLLLFTGIFTTFAQEYQPKDTWPFVYDEFLQGSTRIRNSEVLSEGKFNVSVNDGSLLYISPEETIMKADMQNVRAAMIGDDTYMNIGGRMFRLLSELDLGCVVMSTEINEDALGKVSIGYGISSATGSAEKIHLIQDGQSNMYSKHVDKIVSSKEAGTVIPVKEVRYLYVKRNLVPATKQEVTNFPGVDKNEAKKFFKQEDIKWKDTASLEKVVIFLNSQIPG